MNSNSIGDRTFNPWLERQGTRVVTSEANWAKPLKWNRDAAKAGVRKTVFCASLADVFEDWDGPIHDSKGNRLAVWPDGSHVNGPVNEHQTLPFISGGARSRWLTMAEVRRQLFDLIDATPNLDWLLLTKRPENILAMWPDEQQRRNVWPGTSISTQEHANLQIPLLLKCRGLCAGLFVSIEPMLGPVDLCALPTSTGHTLNALNGFMYGDKCDDPRWSPGNHPRIEWVIVGGESGPNARPMHPDWVRSLRDQCQAAGVPFHFKRWGEWVPESQIQGMPSVAVWHQWANDERSFRVGVRRSGAMLDGREWRETPFDNVENP